jgi:hypothetical protein
MPYAVRSLAGTAVAVLALGGPAAAQAATTHHKKHHAVRHATVAQTTTSTGTSSSTAPNGETVVTGTAATSASSAALAAVPGGTVDRASTETDGASNGAYEVHVTKSDGSRVVVIEDSSFSVLSVNSDAGGCGGHGGPTSGSTSG